ncbi:MAG: TIGR03118 family protein [Bacteroidota bacterium]|nr:TIGR03118 family protein [Bacteroidota bacterium]
MATSLQKKQPVVKSFYLLLLFFMLAAACRKNEIPALLNGYKQTNLVADKDGFHAAMIDPGLVNAWGLAFAPSGPIWISDNGSGLSTIYDRNGVTLRPPVTIPQPGGGGGGTPTGVLFNNTPDFPVWTGKQSQPAKFIFATEDGTIVAWASGNSASIVADQSGFNAVYKGIALAQDGGENFLYVTNFHEARIDVFDKDFNLVSGRSFHDQGIPEGFAPFNIRNIGGWLYVTYARQKPDHHDDQAGPGNGYITIFKPDGSMVKRFASRGALNSPWGIVQAKAEFSTESENAILIGNFGDGRINLYDRDGRFLGPLKDDGRPIQIEGLWSLENEVPTADPDQLFFTAGPVMESHGIFGYLKKRH